VTCTKTEPKNDLFLNCQRKTKELSEKELSNVAPASLSMLQYILSKFTVYFRPRTTGFSLAL